jgi:hypothetical protein
MEGTTMVGKHALHAFTTRTGHRGRTLAGGLLAAVVLGVAGCDNPAPNEPAAPELHLSKPPTATVTTFATGLDNPRGLKFGPDGKLYVAEGGAGGTASTDGQCTQVVPPIGPYTGGYNARISKIDRWGNRTTVVDNLPSSQTSAITGGLTSGVADIAFVGRTLYAVLAGAGCSHGIPDVPNGVIRVNRDGTWKLAADLSAFLAAHPVAHPEPDDFEPDGTYYGMVAVRGELYAVEPNHGEIDRIIPNRWGGATVRRLIDISATQGHIVPTVLAHHGDFYVSNLSTFPLVPGASKILQITPSGHIARTFGHLTGVLGIAFDRWGRLYALENTVCPTADPCGPTPGTGALVRVKPNGDVETVASGLMLPTGMTIGPDGAFYVSVNGFGFPAGAGEIARIALGQ